MAATSSSPPSKPSPRERDVSIVTEKDKVQRLNSALKRNLMRRKMLKTAVSRDDARDDRD